MTELAALSHSGVRQLLRAKHHDWTDILHSMKKAVATKMISLALYDHLHQHLLSVLNEKRARDDDSYIDDDEDEDEREEQAKRPRVDSDDETANDNEDVLPQMPYEMLVAMFTKMPWYQVYASRKISERVRAIIDTRILHTIREIVIDDEDRHQMASGYDLPVLLLELLKNPSMPVNTLTKLTVSRTVFPQGYDMGNVDAKDTDPYNMAIREAMRLHHDTLRELSIRGVGIQHTKEWSDPVGIPDFAVDFPDFSNLHVLDVKPFIDWRGPHMGQYVYDELIEKLAGSSKLKELRIPYVAATARFNITSNSWSMFPTSPYLHSKGFNGALTDSQTVRRWRKDKRHRGSYVLLDDVYVTIVSKTVEHIHFYSMDTARSVVRNVNNLAEVILQTNMRDWVGFPLEQYLPNQKMLFPNAQSVMFDGPYSEWNKIPQQLLVGDKCKIITSTPNMWVTLDATPIDTKVQRICMFNSFGSIVFQPHGTLAVADIADKCPSISQLFIERSANFDYTSEGRVAGNNVTLYHVGSIPIDAMKNIEYDLIDELRTVSWRNSEDTPYQMDISEQMVHTEASLRRTFAPYYAAENFVNLKHISYWGMDKMEQNLKMLGRAHVVNQLMGLEELSVVCTVDSNKFFRDAIAKIGHRPCEFIVLQSAVQPLPPTLDDANMRTQQCKLWPVDDDTLSWMVDFDNLHSDTIINGRYAREWFSPMK